MPLVVPAGSTGNASTPDHASFAGTDVDVIMHMAPDIWGAFFISNQIIGQYQPGAAGNVAWAATMHVTNARLAIWPTGDDPGIGPEAGAAFTFAPKTTHWHHQAFDGNNGAGGRVFTYEVSEDGTSWSALGAPITEAGTAAPFNSTLPIKTPAGLWWGGRIYSIQVRIDGVLVANPDFGAQAPGTTQFVDSTGKTWTLTGNASIDTGLAPQQVGRGGDNLIFAPAAAGGDRFLMDDRVSLLYRNMNAATRRVVVTVPGLLYGQALTDVTVTIPATSGEKLVGPLTIGLANPATGYVDVTYPDGVAGVTVAPIRI